MSQPPAALAGEEMIPGSAERSRRKAQRKAAYQRRKAFEAAGLWPAPPGWDADIYSGDWVEPPSELPPNAGLADRIAAARQEKYQGQAEGWYDEPKGDKTE